LNHLESNQKYLRCSLVNTVKEIKPGYGENGYAYKEWLSQGIKEKSLRGEDQEKSSPRTVGSYMIQQPVVGLAT